MGTPSKEYSHGGPDAAATGAMAALNALPSMVGYWDHELRNRMANDAYIEWVGMSPERIRGMHMKDVVGEAAFGANLPYVQGVLEGQPQQWRKSIINSSGQSRDVQLSYIPDASGGKVAGFYALVTDITEQADAERRAEADAARYRTLARSIPGVFVLLFDSDLRYLVAEGQALETFGHTSGSVEGRTIHEVFPPALAAELEPRYRAALAGQEVTWTRVLESRAFSLKAGPVPGGAGGQAGMVIAVDVTERLQREQTWAALHEIATAVARSAEPSDITEMVSSILRRLFAVDSAAVVRFSGLRTAEIVSMSPGLPAGIDRVHHFAPDDEMASAKVAATGQPALVVYSTEGGRGGEQMISGGFEASAAAPIKVQGLVWGAVVLTSRSRDGVGQEMLERLTEFAELVEIAIGNTEAWTSLEKQAATDVLTGLPNRRSFQTRMEREIEKAEDTGGQLSVVVIDVDRFKDINDSHGHAVGDSVLTALGSRLRRSARKGEMIARLGGEEFVWLLPGVPAVEAAAAAERIGRDIAGTLFDVAGQVTISSGVCDLSIAGSSQLLDCADRALYAAKRAGRNRSVQYDRTL
ncbi:diguanylate cyclase [Arthrobacter sp. NA-172]|uniref:sensor domain-containing diguanylate cyclase n=1 Tax=Arthrobacter sp. NA-172 TaxID=3367524 RepID=UPI003754BF84